MITLADKMLLICLVKVWCIKRYPQKMETNLQLFLWFSATILKKLSFNFQHN